MISLIQYICIIPAIAIFKAAIDYLNDDIHPQDVGHKLTLLAPCHDILKTSNEEFKYCRNWSGVNHDIYNDVANFISNPATEYNCPKECTYFNFEAQKYRNASFIMPYSILAEEFKNRCTIALTNDLCK